MDAEILGKGVVLMPRPRSRKTTRAQTREDAELGAQLKTIRQERGLTQQELASRLGVNQQTISWYEQGVIRIPARELVKMAGILRASLKEFVSPYGEATNGGAKSRKVLKLVEKIESLPLRKQKAVLLVLEEVLSNTAAAAA